MVAFLVRRLTQALVVLVFMSMAVHVLIGLMPGDPVDLMISGNPRLTADDVQRLRQLYGLDVPEWRRYLTWVQTIARGEFGYSRLFHRPVAELLPDRLGNTLVLMTISLALALSVALPAGVMAARKGGGIVDTAINLICFVGVSVPPFWLALILMLIFAAGLGWLPAGGMGTDAGTRLPYMVLPVATLALAGVAGYTRYIRAAMREVLLHDFIRTARAKGLSEPRVVWGHALRNALVPIVTIVGLEFGALFSGALVTETMFAWQGMGKLIYDSIMGNDYNVALIALLLATAMTLLGNLLADVAYAALDPRVELGP